MVPKARMSGDKLCCSLCGVDVREEEISCHNCGSEFKDEFEAFPCHNCGSPLGIGSTLCPNCGAVPGAPPPQRQDEDSEPESAEPEVADESPMQEEDFFRELIENTSLGEDPNRILELAEPFQKVISMRRKKLQHMNTLLDSAQARIRELENPINEMEFSEKEELESQVSQLSKERDELLQIEKGILEMENIYRNLLSLQGSELKRKEASLKSQLEASKDEIERRDREKEKILRRERSIEEREMALDRLEEDLRKREEVLEKRSGNLRRMEGRDAVSESHSGDLEMGAERELSKLRDVMDDDYLREEEEKRKSLERRVEELEVEMTRMVGAKEVLEEQSRQIADQNHEMKYVLRKLDKLLGELPDNVIKEFAKSKDFEKYEKIMESCEG